MVPIDGVSREEGRWYPRELSWLAFNERVLQEAEDPEVPVVQRVRYLGIFSNNLDEFFRVRVADVRRLIAFGDPDKREDYKALLAEIQQRVRELEQRFDKAYRNLLRVLREHGIYLVDEKQLDAEQSQFIEEFFAQQVLPELEPVLLEDKRPIPHLTDESIYLAVQILSGEERRYAMIEIPTQRLDRFIEIPRKKKRQKKVYIVLDNIIRHCMNRVFRGVIPIDSSESYTIKFTRDAELALDEGISQSLIDKMTSSLKRRKRGDPVRFIYDSSMPEAMLEYLTRRFNLSKYDHMAPGGRYHNSKDFMGFPNVGAPELEVAPLPPIPVPALSRCVNIFSCIRDADVLLYYPYHSFSHITEFVQTAAIDPQVYDIKICLYRVASNSRIIDALLNAVANNKRVTAVVELQARFDEEANISWARRLTDGGVNVIFGIPGLKVHGKLILISRREDGETRYYGHVGTGNFNEKTARLYTDFSLLTYNQEIGADIANVFDFVQYTYHRHEYRHLLVSPHSSRPGLVALIDREIEHALAGRTARMMLKCNNLVDVQLINKLYEASRAGVDVRLIIRGMCSLVPGVKGTSENIRVISIVDRFLEHPRVYSFYNNGDPIYYIGSADLMTRNIDFRVEVCCPVYDPAAKQVIQDILDQQWHDNVKARLIDATQSNARVERGKNAPLRSQTTIYRYLSDGKLPRYPQP